MCFSASLSIAEWRAWRPPIAPEDAPGIGPDKEAGGPKNVTVETERFAASAGELPPILQLVLVFVFNEMPLEKLLYGVRALVQ